MDRAAVKPLKMDSLIKWKEKEYQRQMLLAELGN
tara:strand:+ start:476 stop:577 length:102 start_codon:yes stop_codon:yes gene_type:complete